MVLLIIISAINAYAVYVVSAVVRTEPGRRNVVGLAGGLTNMRRFWIVTISTLNSSTNTKSDVFIKRRRFVILKNFLMVI